VKRLIVSILKSRSPLAFALVLVWPIGCVSALRSDAASRGPLATSLQMPAPSRAVQLRASFDKDPSVYIGRFVPDSVADGDVDENTAMVTRCSKYIKPKYVETDQVVDETMWVSHKAAASLGLPTIASAHASAESRDEVRVKYSLTKKVQSDIDADGLAQCCKADSSQCSRRIIGEFLLGSGDVLLTAKDAQSLTGEVETPKPISASASYGADEAWRKKTSFKDVYFAFSTETTSLAATPSTPASAATDCSWCDSIPGSLDGKYFCGVSPAASDESASRALALRAAREQVVDYLGQSVPGSASLSDKDVRATAADGIASLVKDERWCRERIPTPEGEKVRSKVLAFYPKSAEDAGKKTVTAATRGAAKSEKH
jgi:hypothetical protein